MDKRRWLAGRKTVSAEDCDAAHVAARRGRLKPRETVATLMLGTSSIAFAMVTTVATLPGVFGLEVPRWSERRAFMVEASPRKFDRDPHTNQQMPVLVPAGTVHVPSHECDLLAFLSLILGADRNRAIRATTDVLVPVGNRLFRHAFDDGDRRLLQPAGDRCAVTRQ